MIGAIKQRELHEPSADEAESENAAVQIKALCAQAIAFAGACSNPAMASQNCPIYTRIRDDVLAAIDGLEDSFYRDFSAFHAIEMCVVANEFALAHELYRTLTVAYIRWKTEQQHPWIFVIH